MGASAADEESGDDEVNPDSEVEQRSAEDHYERRKIEHEVHSAAIVDAKVVLLAKHDIEKPYKGCQNAKSRSAANGNRQKKDEYVLRPYLPPNSKEEPIARKYRNHE